MARLLDMSSEFEEMFNSLENMELEIEINDDGEPIDSEGNVIDVEAYLKEKEDDWFEVLENMEGEFKDKAVNLATYIKVVDSEVNLLAEEIKSLQKRKKTRENRIKSLKNYLLICMDKMSISKIDDVRAVISTRTSKQTKFYDEEAFIKEMKGCRDELLKYSEPSINKTAVKKALESGDEINGAYIAENKSITIK